MTISTINPKVVIFSRFLYGTHVNMAAWIRPCLVDFALREVKGMTYIDYLKQTEIPLFKGADTYWRIYSGSLIPASPVPEFVSVDAETVRRLLDESSAHLIRWSSDPSDQETPWWWTVCDEYGLDLLASKMRNQVKRGYKECSTRRISAEWLADFGYECYLAAFSRYRHATPASQNDFKAPILQHVEYESVFQYWGVFVAERLVGYTECAVEAGKGVVTGVIKYDPDYLRRYPSYAMMDTLLNHYVAERGLPVNNGTRTISHDTNMQDFLLKFGFRRQYCTLNVQYRRLVGLAVMFLYPLRKLLPGWQAGRNIRALLFQEELKRECQYLMAK